MATRTVLVCDRPHCDRQDAETLELRLGTSKWEVELCPDHRDELLLAEAWRRDTAVIRPRNAAEAKTFALYNPRIRPPLTAAELGHPDILQ